MAELITIKDLNNQLQLKPRFKVEISGIDIYDRIKTYQNLKTPKSVILKRLDEHVWLSIPISERHYYSPRLHIEIEQREDDCVLHCTFGPNPNLWTLFMFVHFFLGLAFLGLVVWLYTNLALDHSNTLIYVLMCFIVLSWIGLYVFARKNRKQAAPQSQTLLKTLSQLIC
jgi:hypothetical protein